MIDNDTTLDRAKPIALGLILAAFAVAGLLILVQLQHVLVLVFLAVVVAAALSRPAAALERRGVRRGAAIVAVQLAAFVVMLGLVWVVVPPLVTEVGRFAHDAPSYVNRLKYLRRDIAVFQHQYPQTGAFDPQVASLAGKLAGDLGGRIVNLPLSAAQMFFDVMMIYALSVLFALRREQMLDSMTLLVAPRRRERVRDVMEKIWDRLGGYLGAKVVVMVCVGALMYVALRVLGVPFAVPLAVIAAFGEVVPKIGVWIARIPLLTIAAFQGWETLGLTFLASAVIEDIKAYVIGPRVEGQTLSMDPVVTMVAVLCGTALLGWEGALIAVPVAAVLQVLCEEVVLPARQAQFAEAAAAEETAARPTQPVRPSQRLAGM